MANNSTLYTLIDIVFIDPKTKIQYIATPGQCYLYSDNLFEVKEAAAGVWLYCGTQAESGEIVLDTADGVYTPYDLAHLVDVNHPVGWPGGLRMCYSHTAYTASRDMIIGRSRFPVYEHPLGAKDFVTLLNSALATDYVPRLPALYAKYSKEVFKALKATDADVVELYDGTNASNKRLESFIRTPIPIILEPFSAIAKRNKMSTHTCISAWRLAFHNACCVAGHKLYIGWDPNPVYPTKTYRISRALYDTYLTDPTCGFITPRLKIKSHVNFKDPFKHIDRFRAPIDIALRLHNALHVRPSKLY